MHKAVRSSNYFFQFFHILSGLADKKEVSCVRILFEIHLTEHGRFHFQDRTTFYTPVLVPPSRHMTSKRRRCDVMTLHRRQYDVI